MITINDVIYLTGYPTQTTSKGQDCVAVYSFALNPEDITPSGSCNFSRIDNSQLVLTLDSANKACKATVYAMNYNVVRIMSGMGGLAYSN